MTETGTTATPVSASLACAHGASSSHSTSPSSVRRRTTSCRARIDSGSFFRGQRRSSIGAKLIAALVERRKLDLADVEAERRGEANAFLEVVAQHLDVALLHHRADERARLRAPECVRDEHRHHLIRDLDELLLLLARRALEQHALVGNAG